MLMAEEFNTAYIDDPTMLITNIYKPSETPGIELQEAHVWCTGVRMPRMWKVMCSRAVYCETNHSSGFVSWWYFPGYTIPTLRDV